MAGGCLVLAVLEEGGQPDDSALPPEGARFRRKQLSAPPLKKEDKESGGQVGELRAGCGELKARVTLA